jgi:hypothetical protein
MARYYCCQLTYVCSVLPLACPSNGSVLALCSCAVLAHLSIPQHHRTALSFDASRAQPIDSRSEHMNGDTRLLDRKRGGVKRKERKKDGKGHHCAQELIWTWLANHMRAGQPLQPSSHPHPS